MAIIAITTSNPGVDLDEDVLVAVVVVDAGVGVVVVVTPQLYRPYHQRISWELPCSCRYDF